MLRQAQKQLEKIENETPGNVTGADAEYCCLYRRCNDWHEDERFGELAKQTLIRSLKKKRKN